MVATRLGSASGEIDEVDAVGEVGLHFGGDLQGQAGFAGAAGAGKGYEADVGLAQQVADQGDFCFAADEPVELGGQVGGGQGGGWRGGGHDGHVFAAQQGLVEGGGFGQGGDAEFVGQQLGAALVLA